ncbi:MAG: hypothetical protein ACM33V_01020, partial [Chloroflexota bacterium]|nr:hypothetical protein [Anaerolineales bacterium]
IVPAMAIRFSIVFTALTWLMIWFVYLATHDRLRSIFIGTLAVWSIDSSGQIYRLLAGYFSPPFSYWLHPLLILLFAALVIFMAQKTVWYRLKPERWGAKSILYLNLVGGLFLVLAVLPIFEFWADAKDDAVIPWRESFTPQAVSITKPASPPDIYYIILDGYGRQDMLEQIYRFNNDKFTAYLKSRGFFVADMAHSNYVQTPLSLSASLNFDYINFAEEYAGPRSINRLPLFDLLRNSRARALLESAGYRFVSTSSGYPFTEFTDADVYLSPYLHSLNELERFYLSTTALDSFISTDTPWGNSLRYYLPLPGYEASRQRILYSLQELQRIPELEGPKFVFVHIVGPHPPFVLNHLGEAVEPSHVYLAGDGEAFGGSKTDYQQQYAEQLVFINAQMQIAIDAILEKSPRPPIILIQGDHGPGSLLIRDSVDRTCLFERTSILSAYYLPDSTLNITPGISPVNSFRLIFNTYFGTDLDLLPDRTYFSPQSWPYDFTDVTDKAERSCMP